MSSTPPTIKLNDEQIDDLLYCARAGELEDLSAYLDELVPSSSGDVVKGKQAVLQQVQDASGNGMFHYVGANGHLATFTLLSPLTTLPLLLHQNSSGNTPLHWAGLNGHLPLVKAIVERVEELEKVDVEGAKGIRVKQRDEERRRREEGRRRRKEEEKAGKKEGESEGEAGKATNGDNVKTAAEDDEEPPELSLWDLRNNFGRGPTSESQMNEREEVVQWLLARMAAGGGSSAAAAASEEEKETVDDKETEELERRTEQVALEEREKA